MAGAGRRSEPVYCLGAGVLQVAMSLHHNNRQRLVQRLRKHSDALAPNSFVLLEGGKALSRGSSDTEIVFRQESYFHWTFGVLEPEFLGAVGVDTGRAVLFMPRLSEDYAVFMGALSTPEEIRLKYGVDEVVYVDEMRNYFRRQKSLGQLLTLHGQNTDSGSYTAEAAFEGIDEFKVNNTLLFTEITECRVIKSEEELTVLRYVNRVSSAAHRQLMRHVRPGMHEYQAESFFQYYVYTHGGMRHCSYTCIGASGCNCSVLHYGHAGAPNERCMQDGDMCLFDMGGEYYCYAADITCSFPVNGRFTQEQRIIYEAVLRANRAVLSAVRPGVQWSDMHLLAERVLLGELLQHGVVRGDVEAMMAARLGAVFMPHGLGHFMGIDVHDVGGYESDSAPRSQEPGLRSLRTGRTLQENMVLTIEPGCYFIEALLNGAVANPQLAGFLVPEQIERFRHFGGVRIEDDIIVTQDGAELMTDVPRTVEEIEAWMAGTSSLWQGDQSAFEKPLVR